MGQFVVGLFLEDTRRSEPVNFLLGPSSGGRSESNGARIEFGTYFCSPVSV